MDFRVITKSLTGALIALTSLFAHAQSIRTVGPVAQAQPYDFSYRVEGIGDERPTLAFSDGQDTYIQVPGLRESWRVVGASYFWQGPYLVVPGQPQTITVQLTTKKLVRSATKKGRAEPQVITFAVERERPVVPAKLFKPEGAFSSPVKVTPASTPNQPATGSSAPSSQQAAAPASMPQEARPAATVKDLPAQPRCVPERSMHSYVVNFAAGAEKLSAAAEQELARGITRNGKVVQVEVAVAASGSQTLRSARGDYLLTLGKRLTGGSGPSEVIFEQSPAGDAVMRVTTEKPRACIRAEAVTVDAKGFHITAEAESAESVVRAIAQRMGRMLRIEGSPSPILLTLRADADSAMAALELVGSKVGDTADIVLRQEEVVLRYRAKEDFKK